MRPARPVLVALAAVLLLGGSGLLAAGLYIPAKAALAQVLLERAWARAQVGQRQARPWPWADITPAARLMVPRLSVDQIVLAGVSGEALAFGPGYLGATAQPGAPGVSILAGHRDTHFRFLRDLQPDDRIEMETATGRRLAYRVVGSQVVSAARYRFADSGAEPALALVTCWPFDAIQPGGDARYIVHARLDRTTAL